MKIGVSAIQGSFERHAAMLKRMQVSVVEVRRPKHLAGISGLVFPGGETTTYLHLLEHIGIDHPFSPRLVAAKEVLRLIDESPVRRLAIIADGIAEVYEVARVVSGSAVGKPLKNIKLPRGAFVAGLQRRGAVSVPGADDTVEKDDGVIVIGPSKITKQLRGLFVGK